MGILGQAKKETRFQRASEAVSQFWGHSNGGADALEKVEIDLAASKVSFGQITDLRAALPAPGPGTTGQRIRSVDRVLKRLEYQQAK
jgi:hypothetical protein